VLKKLTDFACSSGMDRKIRFLGNLDRDGLRRLFARSNVLVFPTVIDEAFGISQVEAMASGLAVITSGTGGAGEIITDRVNGLRFRPGDEASLFEALMHLVENPELWRSCALEGQRTALETFDIQRSVDQLEGHFTRMLKLL
jgi:glycosyltransferase involved in cell wall biosynthesis